MGGYYRSGRLTVSQDVARTELARRLVQLSQQGISDEARLARVGLSHLCQLTLGVEKTKPYTDSRRNRPAADGGRIPAFRRE